MWSIRILLCKARHFGCKWIDHKSKIFLVHFCHLLVGDRKRPGEWILTLFTELRTKLPEACCEEKSYELVNIGDEQNKILFSKWSLGLVPPQQNVVPNARPKGRGPGRHQPSMNLVPRWSTLTHVWPRLTCLHVLCTYSQWQRVSFCVEERSPWTPTLRLQGRRDPFCSDSS